LLAIAVARVHRQYHRRLYMTDPKNPNYGSEQGRQDDEQKKQNERAGQRRDQEQPGQGQPGQGQSGQGQPGQGPGGQSGDRDRASNPQGDTERQPKPGQPSGQNTDR
jgi:hypothetical protein